MFKSYQFATSSLGLSIFAHQFGEGNIPILILAGVHGDEHEGVLAAHALLAALTHPAQTSPPFPNLSITIVPALNLDGVLLKTRKTNTGVDLNRNLPSKDWTNNVKEERYFPGTVANSEPENKALTAWLEKHRPKLIISLHSYKPMLNLNGDCDPEAEAISAMTGYVKNRDIGYPTPGCLGTYAGIERNMPTITYEIERGQKPQEIVKMHTPALMAALKVSEQRFKRS